MFYGPRLRCAWCGRLINRAHITFAPEGTPLCVRRRMWHKPLCGDILLADELTDRNTQPQIPRTPRQS